mmetsp:Transcript_21033/g.44841  ORF Transcript_21033/g.44841 Transcript_21033/m.44841 type:complete len:295 (+) Transcript_21033:780-1664(+)
MERLAHADALPLPSILTTGVVQVREHSHLLLIALVSSFLSGYPVLLVLPSGGQPELAAFVEVRLRRLEPLLLRRQAVLLLQMRLLDGPAHACILQLPVVRFLIGLGLHIPHVLLQLLIARLFLAALLAELLVELLEDAQLRLSRLMGLTLPVLLRASIALGHLLIQGCAHSLPILLSYPLLEGLLLHHSCHIGRSRASEVLIVLVAFLLHCLIVRHLLPELLLVVSLHALLHHLLLQFLCAKLRMIVGRAAPLQRAHRALRPTGPWHIHVIEVLHAHHGAHIVGAPPGQTRSHA